MLLMYKKLYATRTQNKLGTTGQSIYATECLSNADLVSPNFFEIKLFPHLEGIKIKTLQNILLKKRGRAGREQKPVLALRLSNKASLI